jgi:flagellar M-ring protein FliF
MKTMTGALSKRQLATMAAVFVGVVAMIVGSAYWLNAPTYGLLYSDMDAEAASDLVARLKSQQVPYMLDAGGKSVRVPVDRIDELRLELASQGLPSSGRIGFEIFDRTQFGATEFLEHVNYRRALEGELARTIATIGQVQTARVHIAMAKESLFASGAEPAKASVVLKLKNNSPLPPGTITGIAGLVSASVESLRPESVVIVDTFGRRLSGPDQEEHANDGLQLDRQRRMEQDLTQKVVALLEPVVGVDRVRVNVSTRLSADSQEETQETYDPETVIRSRQVSSDTTNAILNSGVAGARGNAPPGASTATVDPAQTNQQQNAGRMSETTNFEVSKTTTHKIAPPGQIARLSVAVIVDDDHVSTTDAAGATTVQNKPRTPEELQRIQGLVAASVGLDTERGDQITVENIAFNDNAPDMAEPVLPWWRKAIPTGSPAGETVRGFGVIILGLVALLFVIRPMMQRAFAQALPAAVALPAGVDGQAPTVSDIEGALAAHEELPLSPLRQTDARLPGLSKRLSKVAEAEPEQVAKLMRAWLTEGEN